MNKNIQIDIIMPCFYSSKIIKPALEKIASQTIIKQIHLIMINDCSPFTNCNYQDLLDEYKNKINITLLKTKENSGPGVARQLGLNNAYGDFIFFHDDDDELIDNQAIENLVSVIPEKYSNIRVVKGGVKINYQKSSSIFTGKQNNILQGCLYNNKLIKQYNISFNPVCSYREEDAAFIFAFYALTANRIFIKDLGIESIIYQRNYAINHISLTQQGNKLNAIFGLINSNYACIETIYRGQYISNDFKINKYFCIKSNLGFLFQYFYDEIINNNYKLSLSDFYDFKNKILFLKNYIDYCYKNNINEIITKKIRQGFFYYCLLPKDNLNKNRLLSITYEDFLQTYEKQLQFLYENYVIKE